MFSLIIYLLVAAIGFMMGFLYKRTHTTAQIFSPDPKKAYRIFLIVMATGALIIAGLLWFSTHVLKSSNIPEEANSKYHETKSIVVFAINVFFFVLTVLANTYSQTLKKVTMVPYLLVLAFYCVFVLADAYYISDIFFLWQKSLQLFQGKIDDLQNTARVKCALGLIVTAFNAVVIWWGLRK